MIKKASSNQSCGREGENLTGAFLKSFSIYKKTAQNRRCTSSMCENHHTKFEQDKFIEFKSPDEVILEKRVNHKT